MAEPSSEQVESAIRDVTAAYRAAVDVIRSVVDGQQAFAAATRLGEAITDLRTETGKLRADLASNIYKAESLSLAGLAQRIGISRARAQDLVEAARAASTTEEEKPDD